MKKLIILLSIIAFGVIEAKEVRNPPKQKYPSHLQTLNLSSSSIHSYEEAMNRFSYMKPDGYVIESVRYFKTGSSFTVLVKLRKI
jgi:hypothetical protein